LLPPLTTHEAVLSSKIEGTQATVDEVLETLRQGRGRHASIYCFPDLLSLTEWKKTYSPFVSRILHFTIHKETNVAKTRALNLHATNSIKQNKMKTITALCVLAVAKNSK